MKTISACMLEIQCFQLLIHSLFIFYSLTLILEEIYEIQMIVNGTYKDIWLSGPRPSSHSHIRSTTENGIIIKWWLDKLNNLGWHTIYLNPSNNITIELNTINMILRSQNMFWIIYQNSKRKIFPLKYKDTFNHMSYKIYLIAFCIDITY